MLSAASNCANYSGLDTHMALCVIYTLLFRIWGLFLCISCLLNPRDTGYISNVGLLT